MKTLHAIGAIAAVLSSLLIGTTCDLAIAAGLDTAAIERASGTKGSFDSRTGVYKLMSARKDLNVVAAGVRITPPLGLTSWAGFRRTR
jgi:hypothetical protein